MNWLTTQCDWDFVGGVIQLQGHSVPIVRMATIITCSRFDEPIFLEDEPVDVASSGQVRMSSNE